MQKFSKISSKICKKNELVSSSIKDLISITNKNFQGFIDYLSKYVIKKIEVLK